MNLSSTSLTFGPLSHLENQRFERRGSNQFQEFETFGFHWTSPFQDEIDDRIKIGNHILRISHTRQVAHLLCWMYVRRYVGRSDANYSIRIDNNTKEQYTLKRKRKFLQLRT
jgi:hypothetical protein